jgi:hypothetical protein
MNQILVLLITILLSFFVNAVISFADFFFYFFLFFFKLVSQVFGWPFGVEAGYGKPQNRKDIIRLDFLF